VRPKTAKTAAQVKGIRFRGGGHTLKSQKHSGGTFKSREGLGLLLKHHQRSRSKQGTFTVERTEMGDRPLCPKQRWWELEKGGKERANLERGKGEERKIRRAARTLSGLEKFENWVFRAQKRRDDLSIGGKNRRRGKKEMNCWQ